MHVLSKGITEKQCHLFSSIAPPAQFNTHCQFFFRFSLTTPRARNFNQSAIFANLSLCFGFNQKRVFKTKIKTALTKIDDLNKLLYKKILCVQISVSFQKIFLAKLNRVFLLFLIPGCTAIVYTS